MSGICSIEKTHIIDNYSTETFSTIRLLLLWIFPRIHSINSITDRMIVTIYLLLATNLRLFSFSSFRYVCHRLNASFEARRLVDILLIRIWAFKYMNISNDLLIIMLVPTIQSRIKHWRFLSKEALPKNLSLLYYLLAASAATSIVTATCSIR